VTTDEVAFLTAIKANPADDVSRLVYADWLQENGEPERAEFIRVQIELTKTPKELPKGTIVPAAPGSPILAVAQHAIPNPKYAELVAQEDALWRSFDPWRLAPWAPKHWTATCEARRRAFRVGASEAVQNIWHEVRRGFVLRVACEGSDWINHGDEIVAAQPVREVEIYSRRDSHPHNFVEAVSREWSRRFGRDTVGMLLSELFRDLWGCELVPTGWTTSQATPLDDLRAVQESSNFPAGSDTRFRQLDAHIAQLRSTLLNALKWQAPSEPESDAVRNLREASAAAQEERQRAAADPYGIGGPILPPANAFSKPPIA
jgi:uncharacterized protein (TIGR02996 family)